MALAWVRRPGAAYGRMLTERPFVTNTVTAGFLYGASDCAAQNLEAAFGIQSPNKLSYNYGRTLCMAAFGTCFAGPCLSLWYPLLHKMTVSFRVQYTQSVWFSGLGISTFIKKKIIRPTDKAKEVGVKVLLDSLFFQAPFLTCYFVLTGLLEGLPFSAVQAKTKDNFHEAWFYGFLTWVPVQTANFWLASVPRQAVVVNVVNAGWKTFLSVLCHSREYGGAGQVAQAGDFACPPGAKEGAEEKSAAVVEALRLEIEELRRTIDALRRERDEPRATSVVAASVPQAQDV
ncbi:unnamed protein product [Polarella glacialis]|uniref:Uncharacterized protein n=1 Tax=Polarella glacialis TaxID=89957 RepID=A0A813ESA8_POLGL|nr:unnamed protein product [Polarella glacialis]CAE8709231.1 unnamed protein product [Polarella glacialis]